MPFDAIAARKIITTLEAHRMHPGGELMVTAAELLKSATDDASGSMGRVRSAEAETVAAKSRLDDELLETKRLREELEKFVGIVDALRACAAAKKGAAKLANDWLVEHGFITKAKIVEEEA